MEALEKTIDKDRKRILTCLTYLEQSGEGVHSDIIEEIFERRPDLKKQFEGLYNTIHTESCTRKKPNQNLISYP